MKQIFENEYSTVPILMRDLVRERRDVNLVFRGISRNIENMPKLQRILNNKKEIIDYTKYEFRMLHDFYKLGKPYFAVNYDVLDYVACAQHYGVPTRLIDWTRDPFVALFFAVYNNQAPDNDTYKIIYTDLSENTVIDRIYNFRSWGELEGGSEFILQYSTFLDTIQDRKKFREDLQYRKTQMSKLGITDNFEYHEDGLLFFDPSPTNDRLIAQQGLFSIPISTSNDDAAVELKRKTQSFSITLDQEKRTQLLDYLRNMNYTPARLFPELESISKHIISIYEMSNTLQRS